MDPQTSPPAAPESPTPLSNLRLPEFRAAEPPPRSRKPLIFGGILLLLILLAVGGWFGFQALHPKKPAIAPNPAYDVSGLKSQSAQASTFLKNAEADLNDLGGGLDDKPGDLTEQTP